MKKYGWFGVVFFVIIIDQASKYWASHSLLPYHPKEIFSFFNLTLAYNTGAAFSFLAKSGEWHRWLFIGFSSMMSIGIFIWMLRSHRRVQLFGQALVLGGALGNLIDRLSYGYVIDFIELYYKSFHWPIFNLADSAICIGVVFLLIDLSKNP